MSISGGTGGVQKKDPFPGISEPVETKEPKATWNTRSVELFSDSLDSMTKQVLSVTSSKMKFLEEEGNIGTLLHELSGIIHKLDTASTDKDREALVILREKVGGCIQAINIQVDTNIDLPDNTSAQLLQKTISQLGKENALGLQGLEKASQVPESSTFVALSNISSNKSIGDGLAQVQVLSQYEDTTTSGFENCGYHALKNALIALVPDKKSGELEKMLNDKALFLDFYKTYCLPVLSETPGEKGKLDASVPVLRDIINRFAKDENPPASLLPLHTALRDSFKDNNLAIFQMSTTTGDDRGDPVFGFFDDKGSFEGKKLHDMANKPGPRTLSCVFGNEALGHWYTLTIHKTEAGEYQLIGMDSMDNNHDVLGIYSPLGKMGNLILSKIENSDKFLKEAYEPVHDFTSPRANWFETNGTISESYANSLLDNKPVPGLASETAPTGSTLERNIASCFRAAEFMDSSEWLGSSDYWIQKQVDDLEIIVNFYAAKLPSENPAKAKMQELSKFINENKRSNIVEETIADAIKKLDQKKDSLSSTEYDRSHSMFTMMRKLFRERKKVSGIKDEVERNNAMNEIGGVGGVEGGFTAGNKSSDIEKSLMERVDILLLTYQEVMRRGALDKMIKTVASGDGCLTARMGRVNEMYSEFQGLGTVEDIAAAEKVKEAPVTALSEAIDEMAADFIVAKANQLISKISKETIEATPQDLTDSLQEYATGDLGKPFREFLVKEGIIQLPEKEAEIPEADAVNWIDLLPKILENKEAISKFICGDPKNYLDFGNKATRFSVEAKGFISKLKPEALLVGDNLELVIEKFQTYASGERAEPFRKLLVEKGVIPDTKITDWEKAVTGAIKLNDFNVWLNYSKAESLKYL